MTSRDFVYWLQGYFELSGNEMLSLEQTKTIKNHLHMVFIHEIDPSFGDKTKQEVLTKAHQYNPGGTLTTPGPFDMALNC